MDDRAQLEALKAAHPDLTVFRQREPLGKDDVLQCCDGEESLGDVILC